MILSQTGVRGLLTFSILFFSLFLFIQDTNADTFTVDNLGGGADTDCNVSPIIIADCECTDAVANNCRLRSAVNAAANTDGPSHTIDFSGANGIIDFTMDGFLNIRDVSADGPGRSPCIVGDNRARDDARPTRRRR